MPFSDTARRTVRYVSTMIDDVERLYQEIEPEVFPRRSRALHRLAWAVAFRLDNPHSFMEIRSRFLCRLRPRNGETLRAIQRLEKACLECVNEVCSCRQRVRAAEILLLNHPEGDWSIEKHFLGDKENKLNSLRNEMLDAEYIYRLAKTAEKQVFDELHDQLRAMEATEPIESQGYNEWKTRMEGARKDLAKR